MTRSTDTGRRKRVAIYREAALVVEKQRDGNMQGACLAIRDIVAPGEPSGEVRECAIFRKVFDTPASRLEPLIWGWSLEDQNQRVLALCFMAAMVEAGDA